MTPRRRPIRHALIHLPPLDAGDAPALVDILERAIAAIGRAHQPFQKPSRAAKAAGGTRKR